MSVNPSVLIVLETGRALPANPLLPLDADMEIENLPIEYSAVT